VEEHSPSRTALGAALYRAAHQMVDRPLVLEDSLAVPIVGAAGDAELRAGLARRSRPSAAAMRAFVAVRSRHAEDCLAEAYVRGVRQYVVLGAGLDTFAYRCSLEGLRVLEVDHPATQAWKRERLARAGIAVPERVHFAPVDFERETLRDGLARARLDLAQPAFLAWLGVTPYLSRQAILATLGAVAREACAGSEIVFDFATPVRDDPDARAAGAELAARVAAAGEPLRSAFSPEELEGELAALGFAGVELAGTAALDTRYFQGRKDGLRLLGGHMMRAWV
jgi:methyltransferase (TIGR00027 family)